jgi:hypothetical protein
MIVTEILPEFSYLPLLVLGIVGNLVTFMKYNRRGQSRTLSQFVFLCTLGILGVIVPHYYSTFKLDLAHFLEHSFLKLLFVFSAFNLLFLIGGSPSPMLQVPLNILDDETMAVSSQLDDGIEEIYTTMELEIFETGLSRVSTRSAQLLEALSQFSSSFDIQTYVDNAPQYLQNILEPIEGAINWSWNRIASKSESIPRLLSSIQTGLLSHNLILVLGFLVLFIILLILVPGG